MIPISRDGTLEASTSKCPISLPPFPFIPTELPIRTPRNQHSVFSRHQSNHSVYFLPSSLEVNVDGSSKSPRKPFHVPREFHSMVAGAGAGLVSSIVTCPLDVVKTTLQAQRLKRDAPGYEGVTKTCKRIWRQSGFRGFYRGLGPTVTGYLPTWGIYFTVYDLVKDRLRGWAEHGAHPNADVALMHILAAMTAGATGTCLTNPLWVVKTRFMAQAVLPPTAPRYKNTLDAILTIYRTEGLRAFYKGLLPSLVGVSHVAIQLPLYERAKSWSDPGGDHSQLPATTILACSSFSKMVASLITYPHEVLRTRIQISRRNLAAPADSSPSPSPAATPGPTSSIPAPESNLPGTTSSGTHTKPPPTSPSPSSTPRPAYNYHVLPVSTTHHPHLYSPLLAGSQPPVPVHDTISPTQLADGSGNGHPKKYFGRRGGIIHTFLKIQRQDGWRGFYRGLSINLVRTVPNAAVTFLTYELIMRNLA
ncbi:mitochondrial carrier domain-containing protein [Kockovaella imperatae]|uniref:Mitochondrial carrier domain-containing protein n=1 Tax=Kockovaella imperatae TaxID=4999 RepID=A0A1Y1USJ8_9TREE|nr:mitochondrial carrier domain-containing protein [Kockovaella imperatae]ORX40993.1 mitochondrial carrier domain-containing protein [Kockovaella imperatae]